jgi:plastocyanin
VRSIVALGAALVLALTLVACSTETRTVTGPVGSALAAVAIQDSAFKPADVTVKVGATVTWTQQDSIAHFVKWADGTAPGPSMALGDTYTRAFAVAGTFPYVCGIHGSMKGSITVTP